jgi:hypothetical protein
MTIHTNLNDRKELARRLIPFNHNEKLHYAGTPTFAFEGYGFRILRDGEIECEDLKTESAITEFLQNEGLLPVPETAQEPESEMITVTAPQDEPDVMKVSIPADGMDGTQMRNLVFMLHAQQYLLNRAAEHDNICVPDGLIENLQQETITDQTSFFAIYQNYEKDGHGFAITPNMVTFYFAPTGNAVKNRALVELAAFMVSAARKAKRINPATRKTENEKYYLRMWLLRIGMGTKASHESRMALLKGLNGWSAFRTEAEAQAHAKRQKERRNQNP